MTRKKTVLRFEADGKVYASLEQCGISNGSIDRAIAASMEVIINRQLLERSLKDLGVAEADSAIIAASVEVMNELSFRPRRIITEGS